MTGTTKSAVVPCRHKALLWAVAAAEWRPGSGFEPRATVVCTDCLVLFGTLSQHFGVVLQASSRLL